MFFSSLFHFILWYFSSPSFWLSFLQFKSHSEFLWIHWNEVKHSEMTWIVFRFFQQTFSLLLKLLFFWFKFSFFILWAVWSLEAYPRYKRKLLDKWNCWYFHAISRSLYDWKLSALNFNVCWFHIEKSTHKFVQLPSINTRNLCVFTEH